MNIGNIAKNVILGVNNTPNLPIKTDVLFLFLKLQTCKVCQIDRNFNLHQILAGDNFFSNYNNVKN